MSKTMLLLSEMAALSQPFILLVNCVYCSLGRLFVNFYMFNLIVFDMRWQPHPGFSILYQFERHIKLFVAVVVVVMSRVNYREASFNAVKACPDYFIHVIPACICIYIQQ